MRFQEVTVSAPDGAWTDPETDRALRVKVRGGGATRLDRMERATVRALRAILIGGAVAGVIAASVLVGVVVARAFVPPGSRMGHLATLALVTLAVLGISGAMARMTWWALGFLHPRQSRPQRWVVTALPWWPAVAAIFPLASLTVSGDVAHRLLNLPHEGVAFTGYLTGISLLVHGSVILGAYLTRDGQWASIGIADGEGAGAKQSTDIVDGTDDPSPWMISSLVRVILLAVTATVGTNQALFKYITARQGEFATHRYAAIRLLRGDDPFDSMREVWQQINVPPVTIALVYTPWALLPIDVAQAGWGILHISAIIGATVLVARTFFGSRIPPDLLAVMIVLIFSVYEPWRDTIWLGQPNGFIYLFLSIGLVMAMRNRWFLAGVCIAASLVFKPVASWVALYVILTRRWSAMVGGAVAGIGMIVITLPLAGVNWWWVWITRKMGDLALGNALHSNISLQAVHARLSLVSHAYYDANALPSLPLSGVLNGLMLATAFMLVLALTRRSRPVSDGDGMGLEWSLVIALSLTTSPLSWVHYSTVGIVAFLVLLASTRAPDWSWSPRGVRVAIGTVSLVAFALLSMDEELFLVRTAYWWETWPMLGSIPAASLPLLVVAISLRLWLHNSWLDARSTHDGGQKAVISP